VLLLYDHNSVGGKELSFSMLLPIQGAVFGGSAFEPAYLLVIPHVGPKCLW